ncbi:MAG: ricin-type beta-trefoil lectin domain protein [Streptosporangiaceae bacterium]
MIRANLRRFGVLAGATALAGLLPLAGAQAGAGAGAKAGAQAGAGAGAQAGAGAGAKAGAQAGAGAGAGAGAQAPGTHPAAQQARPGTGAPPGTRRACPPVTTRDVMTCLVLIRTNLKTLRHASATVTPAGYGPSELQAAYALPSATAGTGQTVAVVDAYDDPDAESDLAVYRAQYRLPACTRANGCFSKVNQTGGTAYPAPDPTDTGGWEGEESLDLDMVSAICPNCHILLVEASSSDASDLGAAENEAVALGAKYVSNSYGEPAELVSETEDDASYYNHPGVAITASSGDFGYGTEYPAASRDVVSVGGTTLDLAANTRGFTEYVWPLSGSGCSTGESKAAWQTDTGCGNRTENDVAAVADPSTGVAFYDTDQPNDQGGWLVAGGTSVSSPIIAATYALAGPPAPGSYPASYLYVHHTSLDGDIAGANGSCGDYLCNGGSGYNGPTGWGTPDGTGAFSSVGAPQARTGTVASGIAGKCLDDSGGRTINGNKIDIYTCNGTPAQSSIVELDGTLRIAGKCLDVRGQSTSDGGHVDLYTCNGGANQQWTLWPNGEIVGLQSGRCLDDPGFSSRNGTQLDIWSCDNGANQQWKRP